VETLNVYAAIFYINCSKINLLPIFEITPRLAARASARTNVGKTGGTSASPGGKEQGAQKTFHPH